MNLTFFLCRKVVFPKELPKRWGQGFLLLLIFYLSSSWSFFNFSLFLRIEIASCVFSSFTITTLLFRSLWIAWKSRFFNLISGNVEFIYYTCLNISLWMSSGRPTNSAHSLLGYCSCSASLFSILTAFSINLFLLFPLLLMLLIQSYFEYFFLQPLDASLRATSLCLWKLVSSISSALLILQICFRLLGLFGVVASIFFFAKYFEGKIKYINSWNISISI